MNNANSTFCSPGGGGLSGNVRGRYPPDYFDKMNDNSLSNAHAQQRQLPGPGYGGPTTGYRSQFHGQSQGSDFGMTSSTEDDGNPGRPPNFGNTEFSSTAQYQGHYPQHARYFSPGVTPNKGSPSMTPVHSMAGNSMGSTGNVPPNPNQSNNFTPQRMHSGSGHNFPSQQLGTTPTLNHLLQSSSSNQKGPPSLPVSSSNSRDDSPSSGLQSKSEMTLTQSSYPMHHQQQQGWGPNSRVGSQQYLYPHQGPASSLYRSQSGGNTEMSQGRRPAMGSMGGSYPQQGGQYMGQQMPMGPGPQRFMMGGQMPGQMYGHTPSQQQMYMPQSQQPPGPPVSPAARPPTPQQSQLQQMQNLVQNSPKQPSPAPSVSSDHGSTHSTKHGEECQDIKTEPNNPEDPSGENSRGSTGIPRPAPSPVGSTGSRSNTPASIPGAQAGSPMPIRPPSGQIDGQNRMTQSPMATQGYNQQMMPPPNSMGYMPGSGKMSGNQMPGHYPQFNSQYPQGNYGRQPAMGGMPGPPMSGPMQNYPGSQPNMYPNGPAQMAGAPMYGNMPGMNRNMPQQGYGPGSYPQGNANMGGMMNSQYPGYNSHMGPMPGQHGMQQQQPGAPGPMPPGSAAGPMAPNMGGQQGGMMPQQHGNSSNKAAQAAQAAMMAAANSVGPRMSHNRGSMSPLRGMFGQSGGPLAQMNNMTNSPNLGSPSLNSMSNAVEQLARNTSGGMPLSSSNPSPVPKSAHSPAAMTNITNTSSSIAHSGEQGNTGQTSPMSNTDIHESSSRPNSNTAHHPDLPNNESTTGSDSTSVDSGFHSSDQGDKTSDSVSTPTQSGSTPPPPGPQANGDPTRTIENISPPGHSASHHPHQQQQHHHMGPESKMPYSNDGSVPLPPSSMSSAMSSMPSSSSSVVTTANTGPLLTSVTQSIASPVTSVSTSAPPHHPHPHHMGPHGAPSHMMGHGMGSGPHQMMPNGMPPTSMMNPGHMGGPNQMPPNMGGPPHNMMPPNMGGPNMNLNQNGPMMGPNGPVMGHNGPMMPGHPGMNNAAGNANMPPMGQMAPQQQMNCMPPMANNNNNNNNSSSNNTPSEDPPEKKKKELEGQVGPRSGSAGSHYSEEPNSPGALKSSSDLSKLFELGPEPERRPFLERVLAFLEESGQAVTSLPVISKTPLDLYKLYYCVREKGGFEEVTRNKKWRDICTVVNIGTSASAAFTLKKNYIRYLFNYECKYDRGGINPAPILAQMEAQLAHKREQKNKRAPSPGSNSNDSFRPPSVPNNQMDPSFPPNMPPPYMPNPDGSMPNPHMAGGNMMMGPNNMMGGHGPHGGMSNMMGVPSGMGPSGMMGGPGSNMMPGQQGMMPPNSNVGGNMMSGPQMVPGGPPGYGGPMMPQQQPGGPMPQPPISSAVGPTMPPHSSVAGQPVTSDSVSVQDPFSDETSYQPRGGPQPTPPPPGQGQMATTSTPVTSTFPGMQQSSMSSATMTTTSSRPGGDQQMSGGFPPNTSRPNEPPTTAPGGGQFPFNQQFERPDRFDQSSPNMGMRAPTPGMTPSQQPPQQPGDTSGPMYPGTRFPGPSQPMGMRAPQAGDAPGQFPPQGPPYQGPPGGYPGPQYPSYPQTTPGPYPGPRPPPGPGGMYGTPNKRYQDDHPASNQYSDWSNSNMGGHMTYPTTQSERQAPSPDDRLRDSGHWSPMQRSRGPAGCSNYLPPAAPSTPPMGPFGRQMASRGSPHSREGIRYIGPQKNPPAYGGLSTASFAKKEVSFPSDSVESVTISTTKRKKLTHKDLAPFEAWRLMLALKSGLLAESTWALDTLNILLYDDSTYGYFSLNTLPGLLEVLTEHLRHCLMQMFDDFDDLEEGQSRKRKHLNGKTKTRVLPSLEEASFQDLLDAEAGLIPDVKTEDLKVFHLTGPNYTMSSRKGLPVKIDSTPADSSVLESKEWDVYTQFDTPHDHWLTGCGDITDHILTHLESDSTNKFLSGKFRRKRVREEGVEEEESRQIDTTHTKDKKSRTEHLDDQITPVSENGSCAGNKASEVVSGDKPKTTEESVPSESKSEDSEKCSAESAPGSSNLVSENSTTGVNHSKMCNGEKQCDEQRDEAKLCRLEVVHIKQEPVEEFNPNAIQSVDNGAERSKSESSQEESKEKEEKENRSQNEEDSKENIQLVSKTDEIITENHENESSTKDKANSDCSKPVENGEIEEPKLSPMVNHLDNANSPSSGELKNCESTNGEKDDKENDNCSDSSPPVLKAECLDGEEDMMVEGSSEPMNSTMNTSSDGANMEADTSAVMDTSSAPEDKEPEVKTETPGNTDVKMEDQTEKLVQSVKDSNVVSKEECEEEKATELNDSTASETEELSASIVAEMLKEDDHTEDEAFQRDDPPLCVTPESRDELGRKCVCVTNIIRSLSCVPGNEVRICKHPGIMRILGRLLLLHHTHPERPPPRKLPCGDEEEEEREEPPRVYDDEHWWWDYLDQLRENTLVILANICGHLMLGNFSEQVCFPLLEGLLHWVICPASVARDPLPTLPPGSVLSPQRLVLEALCKLCIHETNVDLLLATPPVKRLLELFSVLVRLLADRSHQITREFSIVILSLLVPGDSSAARAVALQHPCVSLLVDFLEMAEQNALTIANQQGLEMLQSNPEAMGTSLDMLRRAASILLHMARVPDNRKMFVQHQSRLLNLVMSQILDQSVSNTLSDVLFECSQFS